MSWSLYKNNMSKIKDLMLKHFLLSEICALEICEQFVYKHSETTEYAKD